MGQPEAAQHDPWCELQPLLDQELNGLPENYRLPILLCDLEGTTIKDAARQLGRPQGSLAGRLARGRRLLAKRLADRGVVLSAGLLAVVVLTNGASAGVPTSLVGSTVKAAMMIAAGRAAVAGVVPAEVASLMEGVEKGMMLTKLKFVTQVMVVATASLGAGLVGYCTAGEQNKNKKGATVAAPQPRNDKDGSTKSEVRFAVPQQQYGAIFDTTLAILSDHFRIDSANRYDGGINTHPAFVNLGPGAGGKEEPSLRHRATARITPLDKGGVSVEVIVHRERKVIPAPSPLTAAVKWEAAGRANDLERSLLTLIKKGVAAK